MAKQETTKAQETVNSAELLQEKMKMLMKQEDV